MLPLFPTPYPDEILYGVLCRYHSRCGSPSARRTNIELWGNVYGKKLFLPDNIERIAAQIPSSAYITAERLIRETTLYPLIKPFVSRTNAEALLKAMKHGNPNVYNIVGFSHMQTFGQRYLRCCEQCSREDAATFGEAYWHRLHQIPGMFVCHKHGITLTESDVDINSIVNDYYPPPKGTQSSRLNLTDEITEKLIAAARDFEWILKNSGELEYYEHTCECYDKWLKTRGFRNRSGKTSHKKLAKALVDCYGQDFLAALEAYNSGACSWLIRTFEYSKNLQNPIYHVILTRFLAGSVSEFFSRAADMKAPEYMPFGEPPYPCRNYICDYYMSDVIERIDAAIIHGTPKAAFVCPYCGFSYKRKRSAPKDRQYSGQIHIEAYGWKWEKQVAERLWLGESPYKIARGVHCDVRTVINFGIERKLLPPESFVKRPKYVPAENPQTTPDFDDRREIYRERCLEIIAENPGITRKEIRMADSKTDQWLHKNDRDWYEKNAPKSRKFQPRKTDDNIYAERIDNAVNQIRDAPGKPKRVSAATIGKLLGDGKIHRKLASGKLPKSKALVDANAESHEAWQRRKIMWAVRDMRSRGEIITVYKVRHRATIEDKERKWDEFIEQTIINSE